MNRIKLSPLAAQAPVETLDPAHSTSINAGSLFKSAQDEFSLFVPLHYEKNYAYPLVVWLHSDGRSANQVQDVVLDLSMRNYVAIAPQSRHGDATRGFFWDQDWDTVEQAEGAVLSAIDIASQRCNINPNRIFIAGMGSGGTMAFRLGLSRPDHFAGILSIHGPLPSDQSPLRDWSRCRNLPVFWTHGRETEGFDQQLLCRQLRLLHIAGFNVSLRQYAQVESTFGQMLADMNRWIMESISSTIR